MKKFITLLILLCTVIGAKAQAENPYSLTVVNGVTTLTLKSGIHLQDVYSSMTDEEKANLTNASKLKLIGDFNGTDFDNYIYNCSSVTSLDLSGAMIPANMQIQRWKNQLTSLSLPTNPDYTVIPTEFFNECSTLTELIIPENIEDIGRQAFSGCKNLAELNLPSKLLYIRYQAFRGCEKITVISIPGTVKQIEENAFIDCKGVNKVIFNDAVDENGNCIVDMKIGKLAFRQDNQIWDVFINTEGTIECENLAFDLETTVGQSNPDAPMATLHYPESKLEDYVNLNHVLTYDIAASPGAFQAWLVEHLTKAAEGAAGAGNGWFEFVNTGAKGKVPDPVYPDKFLMTYSFYAEVKPFIEYDNEEDVEANTIAQLLPNGVRAYIINDKPEKVTINAGTPNEKTLFKLHLQRVMIIPPNTGVILYGETNSRNENGQPTLALTAVGYHGLPLARDYWDQEPSYLKNYLVGTANSEDKSIPVAPFETDENDKDKVTFRNFGLGRFDKTDSGKEYIKNNGEPASNYVGFFRLKDSNVASRKAYLRFAADEYDDPNGGEAIVLKDNDYYKTYDDDGGLTVDEQIKYNKWGIAIWDTDWGKRDIVSNVDDVFVKFVGEPIFNEENDEATMIFEIEKVDNAHSYYTLQGLRVDNPTKSGIYIKNGKKVYVK